MNYEQPELLDRLAAEYVLGTLRGRARLRFERVIARSAAARLALYRWEDDWSVVSRGLPPVQPSAQVWTNVSRRSFGDKASAPPVPRWRSWGVLAAACLVAITLIVGVLVRQQSLQTVAVLGTDPTHPLWQLDRRRSFVSLTVRVVGPVQRKPGTDYELWALPRGGQPVSLGLLPASGTAQHTLSDAQRSALRFADKVAVSVEPAGGSASGQPTGPIIIVAPVSSRG